MKTFQDLQEGVYDPNILKAFFLAGGPGSGKSYVVKRGTGGLGLKIVNSDDTFEKYIKDAGLSMKMPKSQEEPRDKLRDRAKAITKMKLDNYVAGRLGLIIDGTGKEYDKIAKQATGLKQLGYDVHMIFVNTSLETALKRNAARDRTVPRSIATKSWKTVQSNMGKFSQYFRQNFIVVDNNDSDEDVMGPVYKQVMSLAKKKVQNKTGLNWIQGELDKRKR
jgi:dephospho-CoA kinase